MGHRGPVTMWGWHQPTGMRNSAVGRSRKPSRGRCARPARSLGEAIFGGAKRSTLRCPDPAAEETSVQPGHSRAPLEILKGVIGVAALVGPTSQGLDGVVALGRLVQGR